MSPEHYRQCALECIEQANGVSAPKAKAMLIEMAETWLKLAHQAEALRQRPYAHHLTLDRQTA
jgi:hypothetical protein